MPYINKRKQQRQEEKLAIFKEYAKTGSKCLGFPMWRPRDEEMYYTTRTGFVSGGRKGEKSAQRWASSSIFEGEVALRGDWAQMLRGVSPSKINIQTSATNVIRNYKRYIVEWMLKVAKILVLPAFTPQGYNLYKRLNVRTLNNRDVQKWELIDPLAYGLDGLSQIADDIVDACLEDLELFITAAKREGSLTWCIEPDYTDDSNEETGEDRPTMIGELVSEAKRLIHEFAEYINSGFRTEDLDLLATLKQFADSDKKRGCHKFKWHGWANDFTKDALERASTIAKKLDNKDTPLTVFDHSKEFKFHQDDLYDQFFSWLPRVERELFTLSVARAVLGKKTDLYNINSDLGAWRYAPLLQSDANVGKSKSLECITLGAKSLGLACGNLPQRLEAGFGMGVFTGNFIISDDMTKSDFLALSSRGVIKSAISGGLIQSERKGKDAVDVEATGVLFISLNELDNKDVANMDDGIKDRLLHLVAKVRVEPEIEVVPTSDENRTNGIGKLLEALVPQIKEVYPGQVWEDVLGQYLISCALERSDSVITTGIADYVRVKRNQMSTTMGKVGSVKKLGRAMATLAACATHYLVQTGVTTADQTKALLERFSAGKAAIGLPQLAAPLYLAGSVAARLIATKDIPKELQHVLDGTFQGRSSMHSELTNGGAVKALTGQVNQSSASKGVGYLLDSVQTQDYLPTTLGKLLPVLNQEARTVPAIFEKLPQSPAIWRWVCYQLTRQNSNFVSPSADEHNRCKDIAITLLGCLA